MKKQITLILIIMLILTFSSQSFAFNNTSSNPTIEDVLIIKAGTGIDSIGYTPIMPEVERQFPESFFVSNNGKTFFILDTVNKRILEYEKQELVKKIEIPFIEYAKDLIVLKDKIYVLEGNEDNTIYRIDMNGNIDEIIKKPEQLKQYQINQLNIDKNNNLILVYDGNKLYDIINSKIISNSDVSVKSISPKKGKIKTKEGIEIDVAFEELYGSINIHNITKEGYIYTSVEDVADTSKILVEHTIRKYNKTGKLEGIAAIPMERYISFPNKYMNVTNNGDIYIMIIEENQVIISKVNLDKNFKSTLKQKKSEYSIEDEEKNTNDDDIIITPMYDPSIPSRSTVNSRANSMTGYKWTYNSSNGQHSSYSYVTKPDYLVNTSYGSSLTGIPYCWGGFDGHDRSSTGSWSNFGSAMSMGKEAGNVYTSGSYKSSTAGLDCSGFVSAALQFGSKYGTYGLNDMSDPISSSQLKYMDILIKPGSHVLFFYSWNSDKTVVNSKEATTSGYDKTKSYTRTWSWLSSNGYSAKTFGLR
ncbi:hypothetical protein GOQ27_04220 [Clostridium sp. D2Q-11]|uniref:NlpC/P60 family protein n=1 Tax=Anaeromonas frigoriresistens TaxID=2683708 RepID=A0A942UUE6_9FIRM|nr:hypothetical protein [Anaeromonas frigoriresistens]MBS4537655.1 hypothetical protein [Anaeromonas frigoriresistens]